MDKQDANFDSKDWLKMWMDQSKEFYVSAEKNLKDVFNRDTTSDPQAHMEKIQEWLASMQAHWNKMSAEQEENQKYWKTMASFSQEASELMLKEWIQRTKDDKPIMNVRELYELWLTCCQKVYTKSMLTPDFQKMYGDFMNEGMKYWNMTK